ncbi:MAG: hypothetical protein HY652_12420 [Acidobacteria bacterium]|nr:hypothetical protein [Acidobacteriota bacterium]
MLGEQIIHDERGKIIGTRVLPSTPGQGPKMELTFQSTGKILGIDFNNIGTVQSVPKSEGVLYSEGQGVVTTNDGGSATWTFQGVAKPTGPGMAASFHGSVFFHTASPKLARLNSMCVVVAAEVDGSGNMSAELWEWK